MDIHDEENDIVIEEVIEAIEIHNNQNMVTDDESNSLTSESASDYDDAIS